MSLFRNIRPRRFSHTFIYIDERRERLRDIERRAAESLSAKSAERRVMIRTVRGGTALFTSCVRQDRMRAMVSPDC